MSTTSATGFSRVTVVAPGSRVDVALPQDVPLADLYPGILRLSGRSRPPGEPAGWHLVRLDGTVLDAARTPAAQRVLDGEVLSLRPFAGSLPPAVHDDVVDALAASGGDRWLWNAGLLRAAALTGAAALLLLLGLVLWSADPVHHDTHGLPGVVAGVAGVLLTAWSAVRARVYGDRGPAVVAGLAGLPLLMVAGTGIVAADPGQGPGRLQLLLGCVTVLLGSTLLIVLTPHGEASFVAAAVAAATGMLAAFTAVLSGAPSAHAAAVCGVAAIGILAFLPALSVRFARLPVGYDPARAMSGGGTDPAAAGPVDTAEIASRARIGHGLLLGLAGGAGVVVLAAGAVLGFSHSLWARLLCVALGLAALGRARLFRRTAQVVSLLVAGTGAITSAVLGAALDPHAQSDLRMLWLAAGVAAGAAAAVAVAVVVPRGGVTPLSARFLDLAEGVVLLSLVPLCLAVLGVYAAARGMASG